MTKFHRRTLVALRDNGPCGPAHLSSLVFTEPRYSVALRKGKARGTGLVRPMLSLLARLKNKDFVEWFSDEGRPGQWKITWAGKKATVFLTRPLKDRVEYEVTMALNARASEIEDRLEWMATGQKIKRKIQRHE